MLGREPELEQVDEALRAAERGLGRALLIEGIAGIGKTTFLRIAKERAVVRGFEARVAGGSQRSLHLPFGLLASLFAAELVHPAALAQRDALRGALGIGGAPSVLAVAADALGVLSLRAQDKPILLVIDDWQWVDDSSATVLAHVARHAIAERLVVLIARRTDEAAPEVAASSTIDFDLPAMQLPLLTTDDCISMLRSAGFSPLDAQQWMLRCGRLPLAVTEVCRRGPGEEIGRAIPGLLLPSLLRAEVESFGPGLRSAALLLALCGDTDVIHALLDPELDRALQEALDRGVVQATGRSGHHLDFRHPLLRAAVLAAHTSEEERHARRALAAVMTSEDQLDAAAVHLAYASDGDDPHAFAAVDAFAQRALDRGAMQEAAWAFEACASMTANRDQRSTVLAAAATAAFNAGDGSRGVALGDRAVDAASNPVVLADARRVRAKIAVWAQSPADSVTELEEAANSMRDIDPARCAAILVDAATNSLTAGDIRRGVRHSREAIRVAESIGDIALKIAGEAALAWNSFLAGDLEEYERLAEPLEGIARFLLSEERWEGINLAQVLAYTWAAGERLHDAELLGRELYRAIRKKGALVQSGVVGLVLAKVYLQQGRWVEAFAVGEPHTRDGVGSRGTLSWARAQFAHTLAAMGLEEQTREFAGFALSFASEFDVPLVAGSAHAALGHLELSLNNNDAALAHLDRTEQLMRKAGFFDTGSAWWHGNYLEALIRSDRFDEAMAFIGELEMTPAFLKRRWVDGICSRARGQITRRVDRSLSEHHFLEAIQSFESLGTPFEVARTLLVRDQGADRSDARRAFLALGAELWARFAEPGLSGSTRADEHDPNRGVQALLSSLTPSERSVAMAVLSGSTNRQIAAELFLSAKTVDHYLHRAYAKLGVRNRTELTSFLLRTGSRER